MSDPSALLHHLPLLPALDLDPVLPRSTRRRLKCGQHGSLSPITASTSSSNPSSLPILKIDIQCQLGIAQQEKCGECIGGMYNARMRQDLTLPTVISEVVYVLRGLLRSV